MLQCTASNIRYLCEKKSKMGGSFSKLLRPVSYNCYELGHTWNPSCTQSSLEVGLTCFEEALKIYTSVYTVSTLFENYSKRHIWILAFSTTFCPIKTNPSGNTVWPQASGFQNSPKLTIFGTSNELFVHAKCKRSSLRSQCWMRLFLWFSNTVSRERYKIMLLNARLINR